MEVQQGFKEGIFKLPIVRKTYKNPSIRFDPESGQDLGKMTVTGTKRTYTLTLAPDKKERIKFITTITEQANGTFKQNIKYSYRDLESGLRDETFDFEQFVNSSIDELRDLSKKSRGAKVSGIYRGKDGNMYDKNDQLVSTKGVYR